MAHALTALDFDAATRKSRLIMDSLLAVISYCVCGGLASLFWPSGLRLDRAPIRIFACICSAHSVRGPGTKRKIRVSSLIQFGLFAWALEGQLASVLEAHLDQVQHFNKLLEEFCGLLLLRGLAIGFSLLTIEPTTKTGGIIAIIIGVTAFLCRTFVGESWRYVKRVSQVILDLDVVQGTDFGQVLTVFAQVLRKWCTTLTVLVAFRMAFWYLTATKWALESATQYTRFYEAACRKAYHVALLAIYYQSRRAPWVLWACSGVIVVAMSAVEQLRWIFPNFFFFKFSKQHLRGIEETAHPKATEHIELLSEVAIFSVLDLFIPQRLSKAYIGLRILTSCGIITQIGDAVAALAPLAYGLGRGDDLLRWAPFLQSPNLTPIGFQICYLGNESADMQQAISASLVQYQDQTGIQLKPLLKPAPLSQLKHQFNEYAGKRTLMGSAACIFALVVATKLLSDSERLDFCITAFFVGLLEAICVTDNILLPFAFGIGVVCEVFLGLTTMEAQSALSEDQRRFLESVGYSTVNLDKVKAARIAKISSTKEKLIQRSEQQIANLKKIARAREEKILRVRTSGMATTARQLETFKAQLEAKQEQQREKMRVTSAKFTRARSNLRRAEDMEAQRREQLQAKILDQNERLWELEQRRYDERILGLKIGQKRQEALQERTELARKIRDMREYEAEQKWLAWVARMRAAERFMQDTHAEQLAESLYGGGALGRSRSALNVSFD